MHRAPDQFPQPDPAEDQAAEPASQSAEDQAAEPASQPSEDQAAEPTSQPTEDQAAEPASQPAEDHPHTEPAPQQASTHAREARFSRERALAVGIARHIQKLEAKMAEVSAPDNPLSEEGQKYDALIAWFNKHLASARSSLSALENASHPGQTQAPSADGGAPSSTTGQ